MGMEAMLHEQTWIHWLLFSIFIQLWIAVLVCSLCEATTGSLSEASTAGRDGRVGRALTGDRSVQLRIILVVMFTEREA
jgi:hypothetical protein